MTASAECQLDTIDLETLTWCQLKTEVGIESVTIERIEITTQLSQLFLSQQNWVINNERQNLKIEICLI